MDHIKDFFKWLIHGDADPLWTVLFLFGAAMVGIFGLMVLFVIAWPLGVLALFGLFFGVPYVAYLSRKGDRE